MGYPNMSDHRRGLAAAHDYAAAQGYAHGFPNFHQADYGQGVVYGVCLVRPGFAEWRDVPIASLGFRYPWAEPTHAPLSWWFRSINAYAFNNGFSAGMPNGHYARYGNLWVVGIHLFPQASAYRHLAWDSELGYRILSTPSRPQPVPDTIGLLRLTLRLSFERGGYWGRVGSILELVPNAVVTTVKNTSPVRYRLRHSAYGGHPDKFHTVEPGQTVDAFARRPLGGDWIASDLDTHGLDPMMPGPVTVGVEVGWGVS